MTPTPCEVRAHCAAIAFANELLALIKTHRFKGCHYDCTRVDMLANILSSHGLREAVKTIEFTISGHNFLRHIAGGKCECDPEVGAAPCITCAAAEILSKNENALTALPGGPP